MALLRRREIARTGRRCLRGIRSLKRRLYVVFLSRTRHFDLDPETTSAEGEPQRAVRIGLRAGQRPANIIAPSGDHAVQGHTSSSPNIES
jgi:hypothetical protein